MFVKIKGVPNLYHGSIRGEEEEWLIRNTNA